VQPQLDLEEHNGVANAKRVAPTLLNTGGSAYVGPSAFELAAANASAVAIVDGAGAQITSFGGGTQYTEDAAAAADPVGTAPILVRADTPATITSTNGDNVAQRGTNYGASFVQVVSSAGAFIDTFGGGTQYTEDAASAADPVGTQLIARRRDTLAAETTTDGDVTALNSTSKGELYVKQTDAVPVTDNAGSLTIDGTVTASNTTGSIAHDSADSGNPVKVGGRAVAALSTATMVAAADRADMVTDLDGALITRGHCPLGDILSERVSDTAGTSAALSTFGATANTRNYITTITIYNDSTTNAYVDIRDGTAGAVLITLPCPAKGGCITNFETPLRQPTANTALAYDVSAGLTTVYLSFIGFKSKV
jgi:hypothetical protein